MHIVHINLSREFRGGELQTVALVEALDGVGRESGLEQTLVVRKGSRFHRYCATHGGFSLLPVKPSLLRAARAGLDADLVHIHEGRSTKVGALLSLTGIPFVITRRVPNRPKDFFLTRWVYSRAGSIACVSNDVAKIMRDYSDAREVTTIYDCIRPMTLPAGQKAQSRHDSLRIATIGAIDFAHKGQDLLAKAAWSLTDQGADVQFVVLGTGKDEDNLIAMTHGLGNFRFLGWLDDVGRCLSEIDVLVHPARKEGLGSVILEAMAAGKPVIATRVGGIPEIVTHEHNGLLIAPESPEAIQDAITRLLSDRQLLERLGHNATATAKAFDRTSMAKRYMETYLELAGATQPHPV